MNPEPELVSSYILEEFRPSIVVYWDFHRPKLSSLGWSRSFIPAFLLLNQGVRKNHRYELLADNCCLIHIHKFIRLRRSTLKQYSQFHLRENPFHKIALLLKCMIEHNFFLFKANRDFSIYLSLVQEWWVILLLRSVSLILSYFW